MNNDPTYNSRVAQAAQRLNADARKVLFELDRERGKGPIGLAADTGLPLENVRHILRYFREEGICDYGPLFSEDDGLLRGRGYWIDRFGRDVQKVACGELGEFV